MKNKTDFFDAPSLEIHNLPEQLKLQDSLSTVKIGSIDKNTQSSNTNELDYSTSPSTQNIISTNLYNCTCDHFMKKHLPCKHMYKLASSLKLFKVYRPDRSLKLLSDFPGGYTRGWAFELPTAFRENLDIRLTPRATSRKDSFNKTIFEDVWTQGSIFNFKRGDLIYNNHLVYEVSWGEALEKLDFYLQITKTTPSSSRPVVFWENNRFINKLITHYGTVFFNLYRPLRGKVAVELVTSLNCRQNHFVDFLRTGNLLSSEGETRNINLYL